MREDIMGVMENFSKRLVDLYQAHQTHPTEVAATSMTQPWGMKPCETAGKEKEMGAFIRCHGQLYFP